MSAVKSLFFETLDERYRVLLASGVPAIRAYEIAFSEAVCEDIAETVHRQIFLNEPPK